jgi:hypothetical protein
MALLDDWAAADRPPAPGAGAGRSGGHSLDRHRLAIQRCAARFHLGLATAAAELAAGAAAISGCRQVALSGGCFQNRLLLEATITALRHLGLSPFWGEAVPGNDGGLAVGQVWALRHGLTEQLGPGQQPGPLQQVGPSQQPSPLRKPGLIKKPGLIQQPGEEHPPGLAGPPGQAPTCREVRPCA